LGKEFQDICAKSGIIHETTSPYTPEHNGIAEHYNRTLQERALTIRHDAGLSGRFWVSSMHTVNFIRNQILHSRLGISPYEAFWGTKPRLDWLRAYGSKCWALSYPRPEKINSILCEFIMLNASTQQVDELLNIFKRLQRIMRQALKHWSTTSAGIRVFGSVMEVVHTSAVQEFERAERRVDTAEEYGNGLGVI
jgi:hypothetical protein